MPKIFDEQEKARLRKAMFLTGFRLLKEEGMTHMSVEKITSACGIGKSTFYNFFSSKEDFVLQMIEDKRQNALESVRKKKSGRQQLSMQEGKELFRSILSSSDSIYQYLRLEDLLKLQKKDNYLSRPDKDEETALLKEVFSHIQGVRKDPDYRLIANLLKIITLVSEQKKMLHEEAWDQTTDTLFHALFEKIFDAEAV